MLEPLTSRMRERGLTLIELAVVLAVLAVLSALALPDIGARLQHQRLQAAAELLAGDVAEARFEAVRRGNALHLQAAGAGPEWCWSISATPGCGCASAQLCQLHSVHSADHPGVQLAAGGALRIDPAGSGSGSAAAVATLASPRGERLRVEISALGRPRICAVTGAWPRIPAC